jgi:hypothetical protein
MLSGSVPQPSPEPRPERRVRPTTVFLNTADARDLRPDDIAWLRQQSRMTPRAFGVFGSGGRAAALKSTGFLAVKPLTEQAAATKSEEGDTECRGLGRG